MKIHCPFHNDNTASLEIYEESFYCFGCRKHGKHSELEQLGIPLNKLKFKDKKQKAEDVKASLEYIKSLPREEIRGLSLPADESGYYIVYPNADYYVKRLRTHSEASKYRSPYGVKKPIYVARYSLYNAKVCIISEGQVNALTIKDNLTSHLIDADNYYYVDVISPGSCVDLNRKDYLPEYLKYDKILIIVDKDVPGVMAGMKLREYLSSKGKKVKLHAMSPDINELLQQKIMWDNTKFDDAIKEIEALIASL